MRYIDKRGVKEKANGVVFDFWRDCGYSSEKRVLKKASGPGAFFRVGFCGLRDNYLLDTDMKTRKREKVLLGFSSSPIRATKGTRRVPEKGSLGPPSGRTRTVGPKREITSGGFAVSFKN